MTPRYFVAAAAIFAAILTAAPQIASRAQQSAAPDIEMSRISGDPKRPRRHFRLRDPARLDPADATSIYEVARHSLAKGYARSGLRAAEGYQSWNRYNRVPYLSQTHGNHYLNNYANDTARAYGGYEKAGTLPRGSALAKDSFSVTRTRAIVLGPLFLMEKMAPGFNPVSGDWKYTLILPDGTVMGETNGQGSERVSYCIDCHLMRESSDHLFYVPRDARIGEGR